LRNINTRNRLNVKVKCTLVQALRLRIDCTAHRVSRGIALLFLDHRTRRWWGVSVTPRALRNRLNPILIDLLPTFLMLTELCILLASQYLTIYPVDPKWMKRLDLLQSKEDTSLPSPIFFFAEFVMFKKTRTPMITSC